MVTLSPLETKDLGAMDRNTFACRLVTFYSTALCPTSVLLRLDCHFTAALTTASLWGKEAVTLPEILLSYELPETPMLCHPGGAVTQVK